ncbi:MAG TPA: patatin-like phospholipase family protein [bacterium]|nr:patatin-like phospholipase family protein [bacterium]
MKELKSNAQIGFALGGGAVLGAAHVGVLKALTEQGIRPAAVTGTSIGVFIAAMYAFGLSLEEIEDIVLELDWLDVSQISLSKYGLLSNEKLGGLLDEVIGEVEFRQANIPLAVVTADIRTGEKVTLNSGDVAKAVMASTCLPGIYTPMELRGHLLVDGGIVENVPVSPLQSMGADTIIAVDLLSKKGFDQPENIIDIMINSYNIATRNATRIQLEDADIVLAPDLSEFNMADINQVPNLIRKGYETVQLLGQG